MTRVPVTAGVLGLLFFGLAMLVRNGPLPGDELLARLLGGHGGAGLVRTLNRLVSLPVWTGVVCVIGAGLWLLGSRRLAVLLVLADLSAEAGTLLVKVLVDRPSPGRGLADSLETLAFPSGHVVRATVVLGTLLACLRHQRPDRRRAALLVAIAFVGAVGVARITIHAHWPSDVLGGYLLGGVWIDLAAWAAGLRVARPPGERGPPS